MSSEDRLRLLEEIWDSLAAEVEVGDIPQSHREELDRRLAAHEADPQPGAPWEEVLARLRSRR